MCGIDGGGTRLSLSRRQVVDAQVIKDSFPSPRRTAARTSYRGCAPVSRLDIERVRGIPACIEEIDRAEATVRCHEGVLEVARIAFGAVRYRVTPRDADLPTRGHPQSRSTVSGCSRLWSAVCGECARKLLGDRAFSLVTGLSPVVCKSIANRGFESLTWRHVHLPPCFESALDRRKRRSRAPCVVRL